MYEKKFSEYYDYATKPNTLPPSSSHSSLSPTVLRICKRGEKKWSFSGCLLLLVYTKWLLLGFLLFDEFKNFGKRFRWKCQDSDRITLC